MTPTEATALCRLVRAACPAQKFDEYTPDTWAVLLDDVGYGEAEAAVKALARKQPFIAPAEIRAEVKRVRSSRLATVAAIQPPPGLDPDDELSYRRWLQSTRKAIADGQPVPPVPELASRPVRQLLAQAFRSQR